jgi:serralysin
MQNDTYVLDQYVIDADLVMVPDDGVGTDTISIQGVYAAPTEINLNSIIYTTQPIMGGGHYFDRNGHMHRLLITGLVENAIGSMGRDLILGNHLANALSGEANLDGPGGDDTLEGGAGDDTMRGGVGADELSGDGDNDRLFGGAGGDTLIGGVGVDTLEGGSGADSLNGGGSVGDMISYANSTSGVQIGFGTGLIIGLGGDAEGDQISGFTNAFGSNFGDTLTDTVKIALANHANDNSFLAAGGDDQLFLGGGNDAGFGGLGNDLIWGEAGADTLNGGGGNDRLRGGYGIDVLTGGLGADSFIFRALPDSTARIGGQDIITDFSSAQRDRIDISALDAMPATAGDQSFHLVTTAFQGQQGELLLIRQGDDLMVKADVNGDRTADFAILVLNITTLSADDFVL